MLWTLSFALAASQIGLGISFFFKNDSAAARSSCVAFILLFVMFYEFSLGPIPWLYMAETMTDKGLSVGVLLNWLFTLLIALITPYCVSGEYFIVLGALCALVRV